MSDIEKAPRAAPARLGREILSPQGIVAEPGPDWRLSEECLAQLRVIDENMREARRRGHELVIGTPAGARP